MNSSLYAPWKEGRERSDRWKETLSKGFLPRVSPGVRGLRTDLAPPYRRCHFIYCVDMSSTSFFIEEEMGTRKDIKNLTFEELKAELAGMGEPAYRATQIFAWLYHRGAESFTAFTNLSKKFRDELAEAYVIAGPELHGVFQSRDRTRKYLFKLGDGNFIETVVIPSGARTTVCLSTQVGCKFSCPFCASGLGGFVRNLTTAEIVNQALFLKHHEGEPVTNLVFMGMGEPLDNFENLAKAIQIMNSAEGLGIAARRMTVSTCGIVPGIRRLQSLGLQVNLSVSLHAVTDEKRTWLVPVNKKYPLETVIKAGQDFMKGGGRKITLEYVLIRGVNDGLADADGLARIARRLRAKVNLIPYSPIRGLPYQVPAEEKIRLFLERLEETNVSVTLRHSKGSDIQAACGQLAGRKLLEGNPS
jgi:23S rRNA (adenine2503-C2)-methyltransferase